MTDIETELREAMAAAVAGAWPPVDVMELLRRAVPTKASTRWRAGSAT